MCKINKKGISPIIATVLIVVVSIILVSMLLSWGRNFIQQTTNDADTTIDTSCKGASITISSCDYNSSGEYIKFVLVNSGEVSFDTDNNFSLTILDSNDDLDTSHNNILDSNSLTLGESSSVTISDYNGVSPIKLTIRSTKCTGYFWQKICD